MKGKEVIQGHYRCLAQASHICRFDGMDGFDQNELQAALTYLLLTSTIDPFALFDFELVKVKLLPLRTRK